MNTSKLSKNIIFKEILDYISTFQGFDGKIPGNGESVQDELSVCTERQNLILKYKNFDVCTWTKFFQYFDIVTNKNLSYKVYEVKLNENSKYIVYFQILEPNQSMSEMKKGPLYFFLQLLTDPNFYLKERKN